MEDQSKFLEMLEDMKGIAKAQDNRLTKEEIRDYLGDMSLSEEQWQAVYQYLGASHIRIPGYEYIPAKGEDTENAKLQRHYQRDLQHLPADRQNVPAQEIEQFVRGDLVHRDLIIESRLHQVVKIAKSYTKYSMPLEELIAEGNLGLLNGMAKAESDSSRFIMPDGTVDIQAFLKLLEQEVIDAIEGMINQEVESKSQETAMLAKTNLLHETAKYLTEENGRVPTVDELSEYTRVSVEEIRQIMGLSEDAKRVAKS